MDFTTICWENGWKTFYSVHSIYYRRVFEFIHSCNAFRSFFILANTRNSSTISIVWLIHDFTTHPRPIPYSIVFDVYSTCRVMNHEERQRWASHISFWVFTSPDLSPINVISSWKGMKDEEMAWNPKRKCVSLSERWMAWIFDGWSWEWGCPPPRENLRQCFWFETILSGSSKGILNIMWKLRRKTNLTFTIMRNNFASNSLLNSQLF